ncbi:MAG: ribulokinase [Planctomycetota bacterium]|nr:MAG: ribulokinase [Planctomycetota bacterium]
MSDKNYVIGMDFGSDSVRALIVDAHDGTELATSTFLYTRWKEGLYCNPSKNQFRQHPLDYLEAMQTTIKEAIKSLPDKDPENIKGIAFDTTGSTLVAVDQEGIPLSMKKEFEENPNAMFILWKDHTAIQEADEINEFTQNWNGINFLKYEGGIYSSEWFWAKILHVLREDESIRKAAFSWVEHCDWMPAVLTDKIDPLKMSRSRCAAGHKAMWHEEFGGLPSEDYLTGIDPLLTGLKERLFTDTDTAEKPIGTLTAEWAEKLGLSEDVVVGGGAFDCHMGSVGAAAGAYTLSKVMGTSTCDILVAPIDEFGDKLIKGICGQVDGSVIPGMIGLEAGQSAFGDIYAWFKQVLLWPTKQLLKDQLSEDQLELLSDKIIPSLEEEAAKLEIGESKVCSLDWMNGRRTPDANQNLKGAITGINLGTDAPTIYRSLVEATAFGSKAILDRFVDEGIPIKNIIALGGISKKSKLVMQITADILNKPIKVVTSEQTCALGAAMFAATAAGLYAKVEDAMDSMNSGFDKEYFPIPANVVKYQSLYEEYKSLGVFLENK